MTKLNRKATQRTVHNSSVITIDFEGVEQLTHDQANERILRSIQSRRLAHRAGERVAETDSGLVMRTWGKGLDCPPRNPDGSVVKEFEGYEDDDAHDQSAPDWRAEFRKLSELDDGEIGFVIEQLIPEEGITGLGALPGTLKTFIMLSWAKAISTGEPLWGRFKTRKLPVLYLCPESGDKSLRRRMVKMRIADSEDFLVRTMSQGKMLSLEDPLLLAAAEGRVVFLDTLVRFTEGKDEQYARDMAALGDLLLALLAAGAVAVVFAHHSRKESRNEDEMTLENCFRGSGDIGAIMSAAHGVRMLDKNKARVQFECVKPRDFEPLQPIQLEARPHIDETGDLKMIKEPGAAKEVKFEKRKIKNNQLARAIREMIAKTPDASANKIHATIGGHRQDVYDILKLGCEKKWWVNTGTERSTKYCIVE